MEMIIINSFLYQGADLPNLLFYGPPGENTNNDVAIANSRIYMPSH